MTVRNLDAVFAPSSVAVIGASERPGSLGRIVTENLRRDFDKPLFLVNPKHRRLFDMDVCPDVERLPEAPDLAVIVTPPRTVPKLVQQLGNKGTRAACVITAGFGQDERGSKLRQEMLDASRPNLMRIVGPNCLGVQAPGSGLNAGFAHLMPEPGPIAFLAQSGAMITAVLDWAEPRGIGFSHTVSLGDMADVDFGDMLDYLANERETRAILLYIEAVTEARKFMSAARAAARSKPVIVVKAGRHEASARAAASHTGALAGHDGVYDAAIRRAGMLRVFTLQELFDAAATLAMVTPPEGHRLAILTNGGGMGVLATDALVTAGGELAELSDATLAQLDAVLPDTWSRGNPVDIIGDATGKRYVDALRIVVSDRKADGLLVLNCPTGVASPDDAAAALVDALPSMRPGPLLTSWVGEKSAEPARRRFREQGIATYESPEDAVNAFMHVANYRRNQRLLMETPPSLPEQFEPEYDRARALVDRALAERREWLSGYESSDVLAAYGVPVVRAELAATPRQVGEVAQTFDEPVAIKVVSPDITHKSDAGGVMLSVNRGRAEEAAASMLRRISAERPQARLEGFMVQAMVRQRPAARELIAGMLCDQLFGPVILFGQGGTAVEVIEDTALALPPLNLKLARELMSRTRVFRLLQGYRGVAPANLDAIAMTLVRLSQLVSDRPEIVELDINPLVADAEGVLALDARVRVAPAEGSGPDRLAIRPYPKELEEKVELNDGRVLLLRPVTPEDEPAVRDTFGRLSAEDLRFRFFAPVKFVDHVTAARFTQIDYDRQMVLVLTEKGIPGPTDIHGIVHLVEEPDRARAEFAIVISPDFTGRGLGTYLMRRIVSYARDRGIGEVWGSVLPENKRMLDICRALGFAVRRDSDDPQTVRVSLSLDG
jgi:acetyltransferase